jgi:NDP-sugar pyrophosphorylase family protein
MGKIIRQLMFANLPHDISGVSERVGMSKPDLIVMAAGIGSRYGGLKQIEPIGPGGEIILDYSVFDARKAGFGKIIFVINKHIEQAFRKRIDRSIGQYCETAYAYQELANVPEDFEYPAERSKPWGTAHAVLSCKDLVGSSFAVINADDFYGQTAFQALSDYLNNARDQNGIYDFCLVAYQLKNTLTEYGHVARGVCQVDREDRLIEVRERTHIEKVEGAIKFTEDGTTWSELPEDSLVSLNLWGFTRGILAELEARFARFLVENRGNLLTAEYFLPEVVNQLLQEKTATVKVLRTKERWFGVTYQEDKIRVKDAVGELIERGVYPGTLWG